jgi:hypothetical protein
LPWLPGATVADVTDTDFAVRLDELARTVAALHRLEGHLAGVTRRVRASADDADDAGDVQSALADFAGHWSHGMDVLHDSVHELNGALSTAHRGYEEHESTLSHALRGTR